MKILGIDYGQSKIGLAISDTESKIATPFSIIKNNNWFDLLEQLKEIVERENIKKIIIGLPINVGVEKSDELKEIENIVEKLRENLKIDVESFDERFSTQEAKKLGSGNRDDDIAAMLILQSYLDKNF